MVDDVVRRPKNALFCKALCVVRLMAWEGALERRKERGGLAYRSGRVMDMALTTMMRCDAMSMAACLARPWMLGRRRGPSKQNLYVMEWIPHFSLRHVAPRAHGGREDHSLLSRATRLFQQQL